jgi:hypothetical protein
MSNLGMYQLFPYTPISCNINTNNTFSTIDIEYPWGTDYLSLKPSWDISKPHKSIWIPDHYNKLFYFYFVYRFNKSKYQNDNEKIYSDIQPFIEKKQQQRYNDTKNLKNSDSSSSSSSSIIEEYENNNKKNEPKTRMCHSWLSGCYMGDNCSFAHSIEDLLKYYYTEKAIQYYEQKFNQKININRYSGLCRDISISKCSTEGCVDYMKNKSIGITSTEDYINTSPNCIIMCKTCDKCIDTIPIYLFI